MVLYPIAVGLSNETSTGLYFYKLKEHPFVAVTDMSDERVQFVYNNPFFNYFK